ncbi:hemerythrin HHE cation binding domain-containing protein [Nocardioides sp. J9]|uniref:hemerythrin domain-containing protein n=1 Tax=Nocardioides sp. J9 TaxID=935844 RepID=UPI0011ADE6A5|nr:hemerythrin domain-containing protein [Nocardioides sp. J9]TWG93945.1 hemerythrin HHE cation binding domain-containing protein [Nocardioides sp. J9]
MSTSYPQQLMLPGQAAAPGGPVDMTVMYLMHHGFRRDLRKFAAAAPATPVDDRATWRALLTRWDRFAGILHHHHSGEDTGIWPWLMARADADERATLEAMEAEHDEIDPTLAACRDLLAVLADEAPGTAGAGRSREEVRAGLSVRLAEAADRLGAHLRHEESEAMVIFQRYMTPEDWKAVEAEHFRSQETLGQLAYMVAWIAEELPTDVLRGALDDAGFGMRVVLRLGRPGFARLERKAFRRLPG